MTEKQIILMRRINSCLNRIAKAEQRLNQSFPGAIRGITMNSDGDTNVETDILPDDWYRVIEQQNSKKIRYWVNRFKDWTA